MTACGRTQCNALHLTTYIGQKAFDQKTNQWDIGWNIQVLQSFIPKKSKIPFKKPKRYDGKMHPPRPAGLTADPRVWQMDPTRPAGRKIRPATRPDPRVDPRVAGRPAGPWTRVQLCYKWRWLLESYKFWWWSRLSGWSTRNSAAGSARGEAIFRRVMRLVACLSCVSADHFTIITLASLSASWHSTCM